MLSRYIRVYLDEFSRCWSNKFLLAIDANLVTVFMLRMFVEALYKLDAFLNELIPGWVAYPSPWHHRCDFALAAFPERLFRRVKLFNSLIRRLEEFLIGVLKMPLACFHLTESGKNTLNGGLSSTQVFDYRFRILFAQKDELLLQPSKFVLFCFAEGILRDRFFNLLRR